MTNLTSTHIPKCLWPKLNTNCTSHKPYFPPFETHRKYLCTRSENPKNALIVQTLQTIRLNHFKPDKRWHFLKFLLRNVAKTNLTIITLGVVGRRLLIGSRRDMANPAPVFFSIIKIGPFYIRGREGLSI